MREVILWAPPHLQRHSICEEVLAACKIGVRAAGLPARTTSNLHAIGDKHLVIAWGLGHPTAGAEMRKLVKAGASVVGWDLGYWEREGKNRKYRVSIDAIHPQSIVMRRERRPRGYIPPLRDDFAADGHIIIVGMGFKSAQTYAEAAGTWEGKTLKAVKELFPGRRIIFRPRPSGGLARLPGTDSIGGPISGVLKGAALAVCRHSNVAVDAIIANVPAIADDGAAASVCPHAIGASATPLDIDTRRRFLSNLSWFQWTAEEMRQAATWRAIIEMCADAREARNGASPGICGNVA